MNSGHGDDVRVELTNKQKVSIQKRLMEPVIESQTEINKVLRTQLEEYNCRLKASHDQKQAEIEKRQDEKVKKRHEKLSKEAFVKNSEDLITKFLPELPTAMTSK